MLIKSKLMSFKGINDKNAHLDNDITVEDGGACFGQIHECKIDSRVWLGSVPMEIFDSPTKQPLQSFIIARILSI